MLFLSYGQAKTKLAILAFFVLSEVCEKTLLLGKASNDMSRIFDSYDLADNHFRLGYVNDQPLA